MTPAQAIARLPAGRWAVGVSGGADSVALMRLLAGRGDCSLVIAHLNHQLRGADSDGDAAFVGDLGERLGLPVETATLDFPIPRGEAENNPSARYRAARLAWFADVVARYRLDGVVLAHHADDQAETVLLHLRRGRGLPFLGGMRERQTLAVGSKALQLWRPLLPVSQQALRDYLCDIGQSWREDVSNASPAYVRNVLRQWLADRPTLTPMLRALSAASRRWHDRLDAAAPELAERFATSALNVPLPLAEHAVRRWLVARGSPPGRVSPAVCRRLIDQTTDVAAPPRQHYPGGLLVRRREKYVDVLGRATGG